jgi:tryptophanase
MGAQAVNLVIEEGQNLALDYPFKGNMDIPRLKRLIDDTGPEKIPFAMITVTNNSYGGQPVSLENIRETKALLASYNIPLIIDSARFAENSFFIHKRERGREKRSLLNIAQEIFSYADGTIMSAKKDGLANIGGFFACNDDQLAEDFKNLLILTEGFPTYGGLAGRDLEVIAVGLLEALEMEYQIYRHATVEYMEKKFMEMRYPLVRPVGGHAIYLNAQQLLSHIPPLHYPGISLVSEMYLQGGVRAVEMGSVMFGNIDPKTREESPAPFELVRLTFPRRVYTQSHFDYIIDIMKNIWERRESIGGYRIVKQPPFLRHFSAQFEAVK